MAGVAQTCRSRSLSWNFNRHVLNMFGSVLSVQLLCPSFQHQCDKARVGKGSSAYSDDQWQQWLQETLVSSL